MATVTWTKTPRTVVASATNAADATTRGTVDLRTAGGGLLTLKITNGATGPTVACTANVLVAHNAGATPTAASRGADWKTLRTYTATTTLDAIFERDFDVPVGTMHLEVEFTGNTVQGVTVEAFLSEITSVVSV